MTRIHLWVSPLADPRVVLQTNNFGSRFFYPGRYDNESLLAFDWFEIGRNNATTLLWTEDWIGSGVAWQHSYYASCVPQRP